jgi:Domain of unknown function (DUF6438)
MNSLRFFRRHAVALPILVALSLRAQAAVSAEARFVEIEDYQELHGHLPAPPVIPIPLTTYLSGDLGGDWEFHIKVDEQGRVLEAKPVGGPRQRREEAKALVLASRFIPFQRDGKAIKASFRFSVEARQEDYAGDPGREFPRRFPEDKTAIVLTRSGCLGACPAYEIEVRGDGEVIYRGRSDVLVSGEHRWQVTPEIVARLVDQFRRAEYFKLEGYYVLNATDLPAYVTHIDIGDQHKFVVDYGGSGSSGGAAASTSFGGPVPNMPASVTEIEDAIDRLSGVLSWRSGDEGTLQALSMEHFSFKSRISGKALAYLISNCKIDLAYAFLKRWAPIDTVRTGENVAEAAQCGDVPLIEAMVSQGALASSRDAREFLIGSVRSGDPRMVVIALRHFRRVNIKNGDGKPLLFSVGENSPDEDDPRNAYFDESAVIRLLVAAGADVNARDEEGNSALHEVFDGGVASSLLAAGADPNSRNAKGRTPIFNRWGDGDSMRALLKAGADINVRDNDGYVPLEMARTEEDALDRLAIGARPPQDPEHLKTFIEYAIKNKWTRVVSAIDQLNGKPVGQ